MSERPVLHFADAVKLIQCFVHCMHRVHDLKFKVLIKQILKNQSLVFMIIFQKKLSFRGEEHDGIYALTNF